ncbi:MAG: transcription elongation factor GreB [Cystobacterineae bacterium]|nr:transcription elongation factor GreB [Cystobacterineae bacterium]
MSQPKIYISPGGFAALKEEYRQLLHIQRPQVTREVSEAAAQGDRSENAEYIYGKRRLAEIDRRLRFLGKRLEAFEVIDAALTQDKTRIFFGATVLAENLETGETHSFELLGPDEADAKLGRISIGSPVGRALLSKGVGDVLRVVIPKGELELCILSIHYPSKPG